MITALTLLLLTLDCGPREPYRYRRHPREYVGPESTGAGPPEVKEVLLGYFGPGDGAGGPNRLLWEAACLAVEEANRSGGFRGLPFRIQAVWAGNPWEGAAAKLAKLLYKDRVWGIVASVDGSAAHVAEQVAAKARVPVITPCATDKSVNLANVPWIFSCLSGDHLLAPVIARKAATCGGPLVMVETDGHDQRLFSEEFYKALLRLKIVLGRRLTIGLQADSFGRLITEVLSVRPKVIVIIADPRASARLVCGFRAARWRGEILGSPWFAAGDFQELAGSYKEGVFFPLPGEMPPEDHPFVKEFIKRTGKSPDIFACSVYDAATLLINAVRKAGLNRAAVRKALEKPQPEAGLTGVFRWDPQGANTRSPRLATYRNGKLYVVPRGQTTTFRVMTSSSIRRSSRQMSATVSMQRR